MAEHDDAPTESAGRDLAAPDAVVGGRSGDADEFGDFGDGVGAALVDEG